TPCVTRWHGGVPFARADGPRRETFAASAVALIVHVFGPAACARGSHGAATPRSPTGARITHHVSPRSTIFPIPHAKGGCHRSIHHPTHLPRPDYTRDTQALAERKRPSVAHGD